MDGDANLEGFGQRRLVVGIGSDHLDALCGERLCGWRRGVSGDSPDREVIGL